MTVGQYSRTAIALHWGIAAALVFQLALGFTLEAIPRGASQFSAFQFHKSIGILILVLTIARVAIRFAHPRPAPLADSRWAQRLARVVHIGLYLFMLGAPITGWLLVSASTIKVPTLLFGAIPLPHLPVPHSLEEPTESAHAALAYLGVSLFLLHVAGALRHQFVDGQPMLARMIPAIGSGRSVMPWTMAVFVGLAVLAAAGVAPQWVAPSPPIDRAVPVRSMETAPIATTLPEQAEAEPEEPVPSVAAQDLQTAEEQRTSWAVMPGGILGFTARWTDNEIKGRFLRWAGEIDFDPEKLQEASIRVVIHLDSVDTEDGQRDEMLKGADFFNTASFATAIYKSRSVRRAGQDRYTADGTLSLHGRSRPVRLSFRLKIAGDNASVEGSARLNRTDFGVGSGEWAATDQIADAVDVRFSFRARRE